MRQIEIGKLTRGADQFSFAYANCLFAATASRPSDHNCGRASESRLGASQFQHALQNRLVARVGCETKLERQQQIVAGIEGLRGEFGTDRETLQNLEGFDNLKALEEAEQVTLALLNRIEPCLEGFPEPR